MKTLVCPISPLRVNRNVVRITAALIAALIALYAYTGILYPVALVAVDCFIRAYTPRKYSPLSGLAGQIVMLAGLPVQLTDKAPKIFAARLGFFFALATLIFYFVHPLSSLIFSLMLMGCALLEAIFNYCVGCLLYTYVVLPCFGDRPLLRGR